VVRVTDGGGGLDSEALRCADAGSRVRAVRCTLDPTRGLGLLRPLLAPAGWGGPAQLAAGAPAGAGCSAGGGSACAADGVEGEGELWPRPRCATGAMAAGRGSVVEARGCAVAARHACVGALDGGRVELARCTLNAAVGASWRVFGMCALGEGCGAPAEAGLGAAAATGNAPPQAGRGDPSVVALHECQLRAINSFTRAVGGGRVEGRHTCGGRSAIHFVALVVPLVFAGITYAW
jgi:hypothetical protein